MNIEFTKRAKEDLDDLPKETAIRILGKLNFYAKQKKPLLFARALIGGMGEYRYRVGKYRIVFDVHADTVFILRIGKRDEIY